MKNLSRSFRASRSLVPHHGGARNDRDRVFMSIVPKRDHQPNVPCVQSKIHKNTAGKSSSCSEYARASVQNPREDQSRVLGPDQTIGAFISFSSGVLGVNGSIRPSC